MFFISSTTSMCELGKRVAIITIGDKNFKIRDGERTVKLLKKTKYRIKNVSLELDSVAPSEEIRKALTRAVGFVTMGKKDALELKTHLEGQGAEQQWPADDLLHLNESEALVFDDFLLKDELKSFTEITGTSMYKFDNTKNMHTFEDAKGLVQQLADFGQYAERNPDAKFIIYGWTRQLYFKVFCLDLFHF